MAEVEGDEEKDDDDDGIVSVCHKLTFDIPGIARKGRRK